MRLWSIGAIVSFALVAVLVSQVPASDAQELPTLRWLSTGDSYSSGEGVRGNVGACAQSREQAWGPRAADILEGAEFGWRIDDVVFTACTGHMAEDLFNPTPEGIEVGSDSQWEWGSTQPGFPRDGVFDVITMSYGGNDIGFADVIMDCLAMPAVSVDNKILKGLIGGYGVLVATPVGDVVPFWGDDCDAQEGELERRVDWLFEPNTGCGVTGVRRSVEFDNFACEIVIDAEAGITGSLIDFWVYIAQNHLSGAGQMVVQGYPALFAESGDWGVREGLRCNGVTRGDANMLGRVSNYMDQRFRDGVARANARLGSDRIIYSSVQSLYESGGHALCGDGEDWINGMLTIRRDDQPLFIAQPVRSGRFGPTSVVIGPNRLFRFRELGAFHPKAIAHEAEAQQVARLLGNSNLGDLVRAGPSECLIGSVRQVFVEDHCSSTARFFARAIRGEDVESEIATEEAVNSELVGPFDNTELIGRVRDLRSLRSDAAWVVVNTARRSDGLWPEEDGCVFYDGAICTVDVFDSGGARIAAVIADYYGNGLTGFELTVFDPDKEMSTSTVVTENGFGPIEIDMTTRQAEEATNYVLGVLAPFDAIEYGMTECYFLPTGVPGVAIQAVNQNTSGTDFDPAVDPDETTIYTVFVSSPQVVTNRGGRVGMSVQELRSVYGDDLVESPHVYTDGWAYLDVSESGGRRGIRFESDGEQVLSIQAGSGYTLLEGCS